MCHRVWTGSSCPPWVWWAPNWSHYRKGFVTQWLGWEAQTLVLSCTSCTSCVLPWASGAQDGLESWTRQALDLIEQGLVNVLIENPSLHFANLGLFRRQPWWVTPKGSFSMDDELSLNPVLNLVYVLHEKFIMLVKTNHMLISTFFSSLHVGYYSICHIPLCYYRSTLCNEVF